MDNYQAYWLAQQKKKAEQPKPDDKLDGTKINGS